MKSVAAGAGAALSGVVAFGSNGEAVPSPIGNLDQLTPAERNRRLAELLSKNVFVQQLKSSFRLSDPTSTVVVDLRLTDVSDGPSNEQFEQFSLLFAGPTEPLLEQKTYRLEHPAIGSFDIFLVPIRSDDRGTVYEAVFNRKRD